MINFSANDYLGLSRHPLLQERAIEYTRRFGAGATASRLVCGNLEPFEEIEEKIARAKGTEAALILAAGWQTNAAVLACLFDSGIWGDEALVFGDKLNHASMHAGLAQSGIRQIRYRHNDLAHLRSQLAAHEDTPGPRFIITESVFSMDGDMSDLDALSAMAREFGAFLYVDDAHATGVMGKTGFGLAHGGNADLIMGTFSKGLGGFGSYIACSKTMRELLVNRCSGLIYSTALPPAVLGAIDAALELIPTLDGERQYLRAIADTLRDTLRTLGLEYGASASQIVPIVLGGEEEALSFAQELEECGILGIAIRPPTVPKGASRIRLALSSLHGTQDMETLQTALRRICAKRAG